MEHAHAILLRRTRFSESSLICTWLTPESGKVKTSARGALRPGSPFAGYLDLLYEADIGFARSRTSDIHSLREVKLRQPFDNLGTQYANLSVASYFADLIDHVTEPAGHSQEVFDLLARAVTYLRTQPPSPRAVSHFESELCRALGILDTGGKGDPISLLAAQCSRIPSGRNRALRACGALAQGNPGDKMP